MIRIKCSRCKGRGTVELNGAYFDTLTVLASHDDPISGAELAREMDVSSTAMCNRLVALERLDLIEGARYGRERRWIIKKVRRKW